MIERVYLVVNERGSVKVSKRPPALDWNEISFELKLTIPNEIFKKPLLKAEIEIPKEAVNTPVITAEITDNIQEVIKQHTGIEVRLEVPEQLMADEE